MKQVIRCQKCGGVVHQVNSVMHCDHCGPQEGSR